MSSGLVAETHPGRRHDVGVDVVEQVFGPNVFHAQVQLARELAPDQRGVLGEEQHALPRVQSDDGAAARERSDERVEHGLASSRESGCRNRGV
jgi:hypothetical protein